MRRIHPWLRCGARAATLGMLACAAACGANSEGDSNLGHASAAGAGGAGTSGALAGGAPAMAGTGGAASGGVDIPQGAAGSAPTPSSGGAGGGPGNAGSGGTVDAGTPGTTADAAPPSEDLPCNDADRTPPATPFEYRGADTWTWRGDPDTPHTGPYAVTIESDPTLEHHTVYRPEFNERALPIVAWANGGGLKVGTDWGEFLREIASYGFLIIADGTPDGSGNVPEDTTAAPLIKAIDWAVAENERPCSVYYHKLATDKVAVMGQSLGGIMAMNASPDPRVTTAVLWNSGLFERDQALYDAIHAPLAIIDGGESDVAYENGRADFDAIDNVPILFANDQSGHGGTYWNDNGGEYAEVGVAWLSWQLLDDASDTAKGMFVGDDCGLCTRATWTVESKKLE